MRNIEFLEVPIISPEVEGDHVTVRFTFFDVESQWSALYVFDGPDATYPMIDSGNPPTHSAFPAGGYYGQTIPGPFTSTHESGALTFLFMSDHLPPRAGWEADVECETLRIDDFPFQGFSFYPNPAENTLSLNAKERVEKVEFYNLLGQLILTERPNMKNSTIDISNFATGTYIMKISINGSNESFKILKK